MYLVQFLPQKHYIYLKKKKEQEKTIESVISLTSEKMFRESERDMGIVKHDKSIAPGITSTKLWGPFFGRDENLKHIPPSNKPLCSIVYSVIHSLIVKLHN